MKMQGYLSRIATVASVGRYAAASGAFGQAIDLPTSKQIVRPVPGGPQRLNSLPMSMAVSPDGRYVVTVNAGYGTFESQYYAVAGGDGYADGGGDGFSG